MDRDRPRGCFAGADELANDVGWRHAAIGKVGLQVIDAGVQEELLVVVLLVQPNL